MKINSESAVKTNRRRKRVNPKCSDCVIKMIKLLIQENNDLRDLLKKFEVSLLEADRQNTMMQESGIVKRIQ